jgi:hypothetical protein
LLFVTIGLAIRVVPSVRETTIDYRDVVVFFIVAKPRFYGTGPEPASFLTHCGLLLADEFARVDDIRVVQLRLFDILGAHFGECITKSEYDTLAAFADRRIF